MTTPFLSRRQWLQKSALAATLLPVSNWYPGSEYIEKFSKGDSPVTKIRLNANENPYGPSDNAKKAIVDSLKEANRYPYGHINELREAVAKKEGVSPDHILMTAGSTELLGLAGLTFGINGGEFVACHPTFDFMLTYAGKIGCTWARTPLDAEFRYDLGALTNETNANTKLIFICNPNNPTGTELPVDDLKYFCEYHATKYPVYIDEAYIELSPNGRTGSMVSLVEKLPYLIIGRTFSKVHGLAGMRIGYAIAQPEMIEAMSKLSPSKGLGISVPATAAAMACLLDAKFEAYSRAKIIEGRDFLCKAFDRLGIGYIRSSANFVFFKNEKFKEDPVSAMEKENILIRKYDYVKDWSRVSIGTMDEMKMFVNAIEKHLKA